MTTYKKYQEYKAGKRKSLKGYKVFGPDMKCREMQYEIGKTFETDGLPELCGKGLHFCLKALDCFKYYEFGSANRVCVVKAVGDVTELKEDADCSKIATNKLKIVKELSWHEVLELCNIGKNNTGHSNTGNYNSGNYNSGDYNSGNCNSGNSNSGYRNSGNYNSGNSNSGYSNSGYSNSGNRNSGDCNSGSYNSGNYNSGDYNSGNCNSGDCNSGHYNSGNYNSGLFNTNEPTIRLFNKESNYRRGDINIPYIHLPLTKWKNDKLITLSYHEAWAEAWAVLGENVKRQFFNLPNFDLKIFNEITGLKLKKKDIIK